MPACSGVAGTVTPPLRTPAKSRQRASRQPKGGFQYPRPPRIDNGSLGSAAEGSDPRQGGGLNPYTRKRPPPTPPRACAASVVVLGAQNRGGRNWAWKPSANPGAHASRAPDRPARSESRSALHDGWGQVLGLGLGSAEGWLRGASLPGPLSYGGHLRGASLHDPSLHGRQ